MLTTVKTLADVRQVLRGYASPHPPEAEDYYDRRLAERAAANLARYPQVEVRARSGVEGLPAADAIYANAAASHPVRGWLEALKVGGRLLFPLQATRSTGSMLVVKRPERDNVWPARLFNNPGQRNVRIAAALPLPQPVALPYADGMPSRAYLLSLPERVIRSALGLSAGLLRDPLYIFS